MKSPFRCYGKMIVQLALLALTVDTAPACADPGNGEGPGPLPLSLESVRGYPIRPLPTLAKWDGRQYDIESGIDVLMSVVRDLDKSADDRNFALLRLVMLDRHLKGRPCLDELGKLFDAPGEIGKGAILLCFKASDDPRGIPLFVRTLDQEQNMKLRLSAAVGLAQWNIRRGVAELVGLLDSKEVLPQPVRMPYVRHNASESFRNANARKGWGFRYDETAQSIGIRADLNDDQKIDLHIAEIRKWFAENEHRFPDWKPGDPLPEVPASEAEKAGNKKP